MELRVEAGFFDWQKAMNGDGSLKSAEIPYFAFNAKDEDEALSAVVSHAPSRLVNLALSSVEVSERLNHSVFRLLANYESDDSSGDSSDDDANNSPVYNFKIGGGSKHITQSMETVYKTPGAPDFSGALNVDKDGSINGTDIVIPIQQFSETQYISDAVLTPKYQKLLAELSGTANSGNFKGYLPNEVLFLGVTGNRRGNKAADKWEVVFEFAVSPQKENLKIGDFVIPKKEGWYYIWIYYGDNTDPNQSVLVKKPKAVYVEKVYEKTDFGKIGIGK